VSWLREDDHETLDPKIGELTDAEYRALHALRQFVAREYHDTGVFPPERAKHAIYTTPRGPRAPNQGATHKFLKLGLLRNYHSYTDAERVALAITDWPEGWLRIHHWEKYNAPRGERLAERVDALLSAQPSLTANDVVKIIGGQRTAVLAAVKQYHHQHPNGSPNGSHPGSGTSTGTDQELVRAQAHACVPDPVYEELEPSVTETALRNAAPANDQPGSGHGPAFDIDNILGDI
jgi:hypothetical protein